MAETLRDKVIRAAVEYIAASGPDGLSFRRIAADAGVSHQAPYHHFGDREAIFCEIGLEGFRRFVEVMTAPASSEEDPDLVTRSLERYVFFALGNVGHFRVMFRSDLCRIERLPELQDAADAAFETLLTLVAEVLGEGASVDEIRVMATTLWSLAHGLATLLIDGPLGATVGVALDPREFVRAVARQARAGFPAG